MFRRRPDATLAANLDPVRRFMPFVSPRRNDSLVYFSQDVPVDAALAFVEEYNRARPREERLTLFHLVLRSLAMVIEERPRLNRFVAGGRIWQRDGVWITFSAKLRFDDDAPILTVKRRFEAEESLTRMVEQLQSSLRTGRSGRKTTSDREIGLLLRLPPFLTFALVRLVRVLDARGLLPGTMIENDPMYASAFVANLGSVGLEAGYHHLWEHGNIPIFCVVGKVKDDPRGAGRLMTLKFSYDERVEDGLYCARGLERLCEFLQHPEKL